MTSEVIYCKKVPVNIDNVDGNSQQQELLCTLEFDHQKQLLLRLSDDQNYFFLYIAIIDQHHYQKIKEAHNLFIDFVDFPSYIISLLDRCRGDGNAKTNKKYLLSFTLPKQERKITCINRKAVTRQNRNIDNSNSDIMKNKNYDANYISNCNLTFKDVEPAINDYKINNRTHSSQDNFPLEQENNARKVNRNFENTSNYTEQTTRAIQKAIHGDETMEHEGKLCILKVKKERPFIHVVLMFKQGSDIEVTEYMLDELNTFQRVLGSTKLRCEQMTIMNEETESEIKKQKESTKNSLEGLNQEWKDKNDKLNSCIQQLKQQHAQELERKDRLMKEEINNLKTHTINTSEEKESTFKQQLSSLQCQLVERNEKELECEKRFAFFKNELKKTHEDNKKCKEETLMFQEKLKHSQNSLHIRECEISDLQKQLQQSQQINSEQERSLVELSDKMKNEKESYKRLEIDMEEKRKEVSKTTNGVKKLVAEVVKGNEVIQKLKEDLKLDQNQKKQMEEQLLEKDQKVAQKEQEKTDLEREVMRLESDIEMMEKILGERTEEKEKMMHQLLQCQNILKTNENVIAWLSKKIEDGHLGKLKQVNRCTGANDQKTTPIFFNLPKSQSPPTSVHYTTSNPEL